MKKFLLLSVLALPVTAVSQQQAHAWFEFNYSITLRCGSSGGCGFGPGCYGGSGWGPGCWSGYGSGYGDAYGYGLPVGYGDSAVVTPAAPAATTPAPKGQAALPTYSSWGYQPVAYTQPYWYDR